MKKMFFLLLLIPILCHGQRQDDEVAFLRSIPDSLGKPVHLPNPGYSVKFDLERVDSYMNKKRVYVISSDSIYKMIFWNYRYTQDSIKFYKAEKGSWHHTWLTQHLIDSLLVIDFTKQELVLYSACGQCLAYCGHDKGYDNCHRNACSFMYAWFLRDKKEKMIVER